MFLKKEKKVETFYVLCGQKGTRAPFKTKTNDKETKKRNNSPSQTDE